MDRLTRTTVFSKSEKNLLRPVQKSPQFGLLSALVFMGFTIVANIASAGNGSSYSGPVIGGNAIPSETETSLPYSKILEANNLCLQDLSIDLWNQLFNSNFLASNSSEIQYVADSKGRPTMVLPTHLYSVAVDEQNCKSSVYLLSEKKMLSLNYSWCEQEPVIIQISADAQEQKTFFTLPYGISFINIKEAKFHVVQGTQQVLTQERAPTGVAVDMDSFTQCLRTRLRP